MPDKIDPVEIAAQTGLDEADVHAVLAHLVPSWLFARYIDGDRDATDYLALRRDRRDRLDA